jgi:glycosyltransferase involved in cell wall biosynthesis
MRFPSALHEMGGRGEKPPGDSETMDDVRADDGPEPSLSIVAPCYNEMAVLSEFHRRASAVARSILGSDYELILVDDGSRDETWPIIEELAAGDPRVLGVRLFRNHGHQAAASAGLAVTRGARVMLIDTDLQDPPELLGEMMRLMDRGADVVYGQRRSRAAETMFKRASAKAFYRLLSRLTAVEIPRDTGDFRLMTRRVVDALCAMPERQRFIRGMVAWVGGRQVPLLYDREPRFAGVSKYPLSKMIRFALDAITSFSAVPLRLASYAGLAAAALAMVLLLFTLWQWASGHTVTGWSSIMTAIVMFGALQLIFLGVLGEYIGRLFQEVKARPLFLIDEIVSSESVYAVPADFSGLTSSARRSLLRSLRAGDVEQVKDPRPV